MKRVSKESYKICKSPDIIDSVKEENELEGAEVGSRGAEPTLVDKVLLLPPPSLYVLKLIAL